MNRIPKTIGVAKPMQERPSVKKLLAFEKEVFETLVMGEARSSLVVAGCHPSQIGAKLSSMSDADLAEILKLPAEERLRLVELIWESLRLTPDDLPLGEAHRVALDTELSDHQRDPSNVLTLEEVLPGIRKQQ